MLYTITLGTKNIAPDNWEIIKDEHGNAFFEKKDIRQRIRLDNSIKNFTHAVTTSHPHELATRTALPKFTKWVNNNKNMNPMIMHDGKSRDKSYSPLVVVYLTIDTSYKMLSYFTDHRILQTYHKKDEYQGCAIVTDERTLAETPELITINVKEVESGEFKTLTLSMCDNRIVCLSRSMETEVEKKMKDICDKYQNSYLGFKIHTLQHELVTCTYLVDESKMEKAAALTKYIKNAVLIPLSKETLANEELLHQILQEEILDKKIRTVTLYGVTLPLGICKEFKLLYVFTYNDKLDTLLCRKSN